MITVPPYPLFLMLLINGGSRLGKQSFGSDGETNTPTKRQTCPGDAVFSQPPETKQLYFYMSVLFPALHLIGS